MPFDVAFCLPEHEVIAWVITIGETEGGKFNFDTMAWEGQ